MENAFLKKIENPGSQFRGAPFWAWNSKLEPQELRRQINLMHEMGLGGFFMHSRVGLNTEYLGEEWFECIRACTDEAKKLNMNAWLYDEDRWPSGAAGGIVTKNVNFRARRLLCEKLSTPDYKDSDLAWFAARIEGTAAMAPRKLKKGDALANGETFLRFYVKIDDTTSWHNDQTYLDTMNPDAVKKFIEVTYEAYAKEIPEEFGKTVPGIFTDEPNSTNWTDALPARFKEMHGYDLLDFLPEIFFEVNGKELSKVRLDYQNTRTDLFVNAFFKQIGDWCEKHNLEFTGHALCEDTVISQTIVGGSVMRFYEYMQSPGIDLLTEHWNVFVTAKQCVSMAHQFGCKTRLSETYGCTGWDFPFAGHKALGDWQAALGINLRCQHLAWYSMEAEAKRDYPASISYQSPWFHRYSTVENYFARLNTAISEGEEIRDLLVIHPIESTWFGKAFDNMSEQEKKTENGALIDFTGRVLKENIDFDFGDEEVMSRHTSIKGDTLTIAKASYKAVLIPEMRTIRATTLKLLSDFAANGGVVAYVGKAPEYVDGNVSKDAVNAYAKFIGTNLDEMTKAVETKTRRVSVTEDGKEIEPLLYHLAESNGISTLFLCNTGVNQAVDQMQVCLVRDRELSFENALVAWNLPADVQIFEIDLNSKNICAVPTEYKNRKHIFKTSFPKLGSRLFAASKENLANAEAPKEKNVFKSGTPIANTGWQVKTDDYNILVLDHPRYSIDASHYSLPTFVINVDYHLRGLLGKRPRGGAMVQPWLQPKNAKPEKTLDLNLLYEFECEKVPSELIFAVERPELYTYRLNGTEFKAEQSGYWCDLSMKKIVLPTNLLKEGKNKLELSCRYHELLPGLETAYLLGEFGVNKQEKLVEKPSTLHVGDWCEQGYPNYAGNLAYTMNFERPATNEDVYVEIPAWRGALLGIRVNGSEQTLLPWPPYQMNITKLLKDGKNTLEIEVYGHRRNSHGPFYLTEKWPSWTGPAEFRTYKVTERQLVPCGLLEAPVIKF